MGRRTDTRERTLRTAATLFRTQGYHGTGLNQVLAEGGLPKGSLYFHFPGGKEQLAAEAVALAAGELCDWVSATLDGAADPVAGLDAVIQGLAEHLVASDFSRGCPIGTVAPDGGDVVREACVSAFASWQGVVRDFLAAHDIPDAENVATTLLAALEGAQLLARTRRDTAPLYAVGTTMRTLLKGR
ncbi:transcriptional regulator, TetR family [Actinokineospora alba]|uniref:Transcriptional regulator, TetR family n=1 Tax=Actinokineospora alba TaxID=504798 RepID=A0A1H0S941_9PSEU|nr:TetR/AcrR family transcriptional regulator [Actinokineospora alba]TDP66710.1 TetR family transcriptional regulator [Actinokineospora alba]SDI51299.1 TetR/AcrR family transcriptional regulator, lmrAB and yxaGH operons repressor [Actinokineospora alba]SDP38175.1 transcriptional regulator, TetR family [Actinokineospora alba]